MKTIIAMMLFLMVAECPSPCQPPSSPNPDHLVTKLTDPLPPLASWLNEPWVGDDAPYAAMRSKVEQSQKAGKLDEYVKEAREEYRANPTSNELQFKYFYSSWLNRYENEVEYQYDDLLNFGSFFNSVTKSQSLYPRTYNFTRMVSLRADLWKGELHAELLPFAKRLLRADPGDFVITLLYPDILASTDQAGMQEQAIELANGLAAKYPDNAIAQHAQGYVYYRRWTVTHDPALAQKAIGSYERYLKLEIPGGYYRPVALDAIRILQKAIASAQQPKS